jgi:autotransporter-associated beta strand protein
VDAGTSLTVTGGVTGDIPGMPAAVFAAELDKVGAGTLVFSTPNNYQGTTVVENGILNILDNAALGRSITNEVQAITLSGATTGSFTLSFNGSNPTPPQVVQSTTGASLQAALQALSTIGAGNVLVSPNGNSATYTITFVGALGGAAQPLLVGTATNGTNITNPAVEIQHGGLGGTIVQNGATLQVQNNINVTTEQLQITGAGFGGIGALDSALNANTWGGPIVLAGDSSIGAEASSTLTVNQTISESVTPSQLAKVGPGTLLLTGGTGTGNTYTGLTTVAAGVLQLNKTAGVTDIPADLTVGLPGGTVLAEALLLGPNQLVSSTNVIVNGTQGLLDNNNQNTTAASLTINDGTVRTGNTGALTVGSLAMTGGTLNTNSAGQVNLNGNVTATGDAATGAATITGTGVLSLGSATRTFNVTAGPNTPPAVDLDIQVVLTSAGKPGIVKAGNGRLELDSPNDNNYGLTTVNGGDVQVDGTIGDVVLNGGGVSGTGTDLTHGQVGNIGGPAGGVPKGNVSPGDNGTFNPIGTLTVSPASGTESWGSATGLVVDLDNANAAPGVGNDLLVVNGNLNLGGTQIVGGGGDNGGAVLSGTVTANVNVGDSFTIIQTTGTISGIFAEPFSNNTVFIGGDKFTVTYNTQTVVLTRQVNTTFMTVVSSANPAVFGQDVQFTATLTGEPGAVAPFQPTDQIKFTLHTPSNGDIVDIEKVVNGKATFDAVQNGPLPPGTYLLDVSFPGDPNYLPVSVTGFQQIINQAVTTTTLTALPPNPVYGQTLTINATVAPKAPGGGIPTGSVTFFVDGGNANSSNGGFQTIVSVGSGGVASLTFPSGAFPALAVGTHSFTASYSGDTNFKPSVTAFPPLSVTVA